MIYETIINYRKNIWYYCLTVIGLCVTSWIIWARFIRERTIRGIPDALLNEFRFWVLVNVCCAYILIIKNLIKPSNIHPELQSFFDVFNLPLKTIEEANIFFAQPEIQKTLKLLFIENILPQLKETPSLLDYNGMGVTNDQIQAVTEEFDKNIKMLAEKRFKNNYIHLLKMEKKDSEKFAIKEWLEMIKEKSPYEYPHVIQLVNDYNEKNSISTRY